MFVHIVMSKNAYLFLEHQISYILSNFLILVNQSILKSCTAYNPPFTFSVYIFMMDYTIHTLLLMSTYRHFLYFVYLQYGFGNAQSLNRTSIPNARICTMSFASSSQDTGIFDKIQDNVIFVDAFA